MTALALPGLLVLDACAALHAKQLPGSGNNNPLAVIQMLLTLGAKVRTTPGVESEQIAMSLSTTIIGWKAQGAFVINAISVNERKVIRNQLVANMNTPGNRDIGLIALASKLKAVFLTHDNAAAMLAKKCKVVTVDLLDLADLVVARNLATWPQIEIGHSNLTTFAWKPHDWSRSVQATVESRPGRSKLATLLSGWP